MVAVVPALETPVPTQNSISEETLTPSTTFVQVTPVWVMLDTWPVEIAETATHIVTMLPFDGADTVKARVEPVP